MIEFVICGIEHSGTTLVSDLFRQIPEVDAGFEVGVLLGQTPREFLYSAPFARNILRGWGLSQALLEWCCDTDQFAEFYDRLQDKTTVLKPNANLIFDKTPRYFAALSACVARASVPFIAMYKDPRAIVYSDFARSGTKEFDNWFTDYLEPKKRYLQSIYAQYQRFKDSPDPRVCFMSLEHLCLDARRSCQKIFNHVGYDFDFKYLLLKDLRYMHTKADSISARIPFEYLEHFSATVQNRIEKELSAFTDWFYN